MTSLFGPPPCPHPHVPLLCRMWDMCWWDGVYRGAVVATLGLLVLAAVVYAIRGRGS